MKRKSNESEVQERVPTVGIVVFDNDNVLLVRHGEQAGHLTGSYGLPGGRIDAGETLRFAAIRELQEETGLVVIDSDLIELPKKYTADLKRKNGEILHVFHTVFGTRIFSGELVSSLETTPEWKPIAQLKNLPLLVNTEDMVQEAVKILLQ